MTRPTPPHSIARAALAAAAALSLTLTACSTSGQQPNAESPASGGSAPKCSYPVGGGEPARPVDPPSTDRVATTGAASATLEMAAGTVTISMDRAKAPCTVHSFESLATQGFFDSTKCHRLVDRGIFVLQCGDPSGTGRGGPGYSFADELTGKETYPRGTVAMANAGPDTNGSQFFLVWQDTQLDAKYTVFGTLDEQSLKVVSQIASQGVDAGDGITPIADASITSVKMG